MAILEQYTVEDYNLIRTEANLVFTVEKFKQFKVEDLSIPENSIIWTPDLKTVEPINGDDPGFVQNFIRSLNRRRTFKDAGIVLNLLRTYRERIGTWDEFAAYVVVYDVFITTSPLVALKSSSFMDGHFTSFLVDPALIYHKEYNKGVGWKLIVLVKESNFDKLVKYSPGSNFFFASDYGPLLLGETVSDPKGESDRYRTLLEASAVCRVTNTTRRDDNNDFVLLCYYVNKNYHVERYVVYQPNGAERTFLLEDENGFDKKKSGIMTTVNDITCKLHKESLTSQKPNMSNRKGSDQPHRMTTILEHATTFTMYGYIIRRILCDRPDIACGIIAKTKTAIIIKCVSTQGNEISILRKLNSAEV
ncbi:hypothetical protein BC937DRAFT_89975 [Endogone sp. FLAS-F59071]|nr:hypothetical protein BC937DRAFT_89975 [Endogone sp. FLAS-F59071]|eukprot:RUS17442.1 hypothetical protein BC937DRAFT_89975 [Endogone sp. FLAS-F59071]